MVLTEQPTLHYFILGGGNENLLEIKIRVIFYILYDARKHKSVEQHI